MNMYTRAACLRRAETVRSQVVDAPDAILRHTHMAATADDPEAKAVAGVYAAVARLRYETDLRIAEMYERAAREGLG